MSCCTLSLSELKYNIFPTEIKLKDFFTNIATWAIEQKFSNFFQLRNFKHLCHLMGKDSVFNEGKDLLNRKRKAPIILQTAIEIDFK